MSESENPVPGPLPDKDPTDEKRSKTMLSKGRDVVLEFLAQRKAKLPIRRRGGDQDSSSTCK